MFNLTFALAGAFALACFFPQNWAPWCDLDLFCRKLLEWSLRTRRTKWSVNESAWINSYAERVSLIKNAVWGLVLILVLPLNSVSSSAWFVDSLWGLIEQVRHGLLRATGNTHLLLHTHEWTETPYELWEICVFLWVFPIIGRWIKRDYVRWAEYSAATEGFAGSLHRHFRIGQVIAYSVFFLSLLGAFFLVVVEVPRYRVGVELLIVIFLGVADLYFCRKWLSIGKTSEAIKHLEVFLMVDFGALIAFVALLAFLVVTDLPYGSHWSSAFVAGASALNLVFANTASLISRGVHNYREQRQ